MPRATPARLSSFAGAPGSRPSTAKPSGASAPTRTGSRAWRHCPPGSSRTRWSLEGTSWRNVTPSSDKPSDVDGTIAFDEEREELLLLVPGATFPNDVPSQTWLWNGGGWRQAAIGGPRSGPLAYVRGGTRGAAVRGRLRAGDLALGRKQLARARDQPDPAGSVLPPARVRVTSPSAGLSTARGPAPGLLRGFHERRTNRNWGRAPSWLARTPAHQPGVCFSISASETGSRRGHRADGEQGQVTIPCRRGGGCHRRSPPLRRAG